MKLCSIYKNFESLEYSDNRFIPGKSLIYQWTKTAGYTQNYAQVRNLFVPSYIFYLFVSRPGTLRTTYLHKAHMTCFAYTITSALGNRHDIISSIKTRLFTWKVILVSYSFFSALSGTIYIQIMYVWKHELSWALPKSIDSIRIICRDSLLQCSSSHSMCYIPDSILICIFTMNE